MFFSLSFNIIYLLRSPISYPSLRVDRPTFCRIMNDNLALFGTRLGFEPSLRQTSEASSLDLPSENYTIG
jgi:hypothetical protein